MQHAANAGTAYIYDGDGNVLQETRHHNNTAGTTYRYYDGADRLVEVKQPQDARDYYSSFAWMTRYVYDLTGASGTPGTVSLNGTPSFRAYGNLFKTMEYLPNPVQAPARTSPGAWADIRGESFDALDRQTAKYELNFGTAATMTYAYDQSGQPGLLSSELNGTNQNAVYSYDARGAVANIAPSGTNAGPSHTFTYDPVGRISQIQSSAFTSPLQKQYDLDGNLIQLTEAASSGIDSPSTLTYGSYLDGSRKSLSVAPVAGSGGSGLNQTNLFQYSYRPDGKLKTYQFGLGSVSSSFAFTYTNAGRLLSESDPDTGVSVNTGKTLVASQFAYNSVTGDISGETLPNGYTYSNFTLDQEDTITAATPPYVGSPPSSLSLDVNIRGELVGPPVASMLYSANGYLTKGTNNTFDSRANVMLSRREFVPSATGSTGSNSWVNETVSWDAAGRNSSVGDQHYDAPAGVNETGTRTRTYDYANHLTGQTDSNFYTVVPTGCNSDLTSFGAFNFASTYLWDPDAHPVSINGETLHWDGDTLLFTSNSSVSGHVDDIKLNGLGDYLLQTSELFVIDRDWTGRQVSAHDGGNEDGWTNPDEYNVIPCDTTPMGQAPNPRPVAGSGQAFHDLVTSPQVLQPSSDGILVDHQTFQGVRTYDPMMQHWIQPDAFPGDIYDPMSQKPFLWERNNPTEYSDPTGLVPSGPFTEIGRVKARFDPLEQLTIDLTELSNNWQFDVYFKKRPTKKKPLSRGHFGPAVVHFTTDPGRLRKMFRDDSKRGHVVDTPENRDAIMRAAQDGTLYRNNINSEGGVETVEKHLDLGNGTYSWARVRDDKIVEGGIMGYGK